MKSKSHYVEKQNDNLTYIMLTFNRQDYARRQLVCLSNSKFRSNAIIADGSDHDWGSGDSGTLNKLSWFYFHKPGEFSYLQRLKESIKIVDTEFVCLVDDQDVYFPSIHQEIIKAHYLEQGNYSCISSNVGRLIKYDSYFAFSDWGHWTKAASFDSESGCVRAAEVLKNRRTANFYYQPIRTVYIAEFLDLIEPVIGNERNYVWGLIENALSIFLAAKGRMKVMNSLGWLRVDATHEEKSSNFITRKMIADSSDINFLGSLLPKHQKHSATPEGAEEKCPLTLVLESWIGHQELKYATTNESDELKISKTSNSHTLKNLFIRLTNKVLSNLEPSLNSYIKAYQRDSSIRMGGVNAVSINDLSKLTKGDDLPFEISQLVGVHELFPSGLNKQMFTHYSK